MANLFSAVFSTREGYLRRQIQSHNQALAFPAQNRFSSDDIANAGCSLLVSGGGEERTALIRHILRTARGLPKVILHCGSHGLTPQALRAAGIEADAWGSDPLAGLSRAAQLTALTPPGQEELIPFWVFAAEVCTTLGREPDLAGLSGIDWLGMEWQHALLQQADAETAADLLGRYDRGMAALAAKGTVRLNRMRRSSGNLSGSSLSCLWGTDHTLTAALPGGQSVRAAACFEALTEAMENGHRFLLVLDNIYLPQQPLICEAVGHVPLMLCANDLCTLAPQLKTLTNRRCGAVLFRHDAAESAKLLSERFFGSYDRVMAETTAGHSQRSGQLFSREQSIRTAAHTIKDLRLDPQYICTAPAGVAFVTLPGHGEGILQIGSDTVPCIRQARR